MNRWVGTPLKVGAAFFSSIALLGADGGKKDSQPIPLTVPKAVCGPHDNPETALQGQVPAAMRAAGFKGFNCNLELIGQSKGEGANWQTTQFKQRGDRDDDDDDDDRDGEHGNKHARVCGYHGTASPTLSLPGRAHLGVAVLDLTDAKDPAPTAYLSTTAMLDPWESLKVNERRQLLAADNGQNGGAGPEVDIYDLSDDCRYPQLLASVAVGKADGSTGVPATVTGHEGAWAPDGLTYYGGDLRQFRQLAWRGEEVIERVGLAAR